MTFAFSAFIGWFMVYFTKIIDAVMDYGNILQFIRLNRAKKIDSEFIEKSANSVKGENLSFKIQEMDKAYWHLWDESESMWLKSVLCFKCMMIRFNLIASILFIYPFIALCVYSLELQPSYTSQFFTLIVCIFVSMSINYYSFERNGEL